MEVKLINNLRLEHPLMNAAGTCKTIEQVEKLAHSAVSAVMVGSITIKERLGNQSPVYWKDPKGRYSLNSLGLPNPGVSYYDKWLPLMARLANAAGKPLFVSVAGFSIEEYLYLAKVAINGGADLVELNLGCPNIWGEEGQKQLACFNLELVEELGWKLHQLPGHERTSFSLKVSPFSDPSYFSQITKVILDHALVVDFVTAVNTFPNAKTFEENGRQSIGEGQGWAGMSGAALKPIGLGCVEQLNYHSEGGFQIIGAGGVSNGQDVKDYLQAGAIIVQVATTYLDRGEDPRVFEDILTEYTDL